jgi:UDP-N-acetylmuramyl pentapeptide synthase
VHHFTSIAHLVQWVTAHVQADDLVLIKGSRALQMERIVYAWFAQGNDETI